LIESTLESTELESTQKEVVTRMAEVEVKRWHGTAEDRSFGWQRMPVTEALRLQEDKFRCPECLGQVRLRRASADNETADHGEHFRKNEGCSLGEHFKGTKRIHPAPLN